MLLLLLLGGPGPMLLLANLAIGWGIVKLFRITLLQIEAEDDGIRPLTLAGRGRLFRWDEIESVEEVDRATYLKESLRCLYTNNLAPPSATFSGVFRVRLKSGKYWLYPPSDPELFQRAVVSRLDRAKAPAYRYQMGETEDAAKLSARWWR